MATAPESRARRYRWASLGQHQQVMAPEQIKKRIPTQGNPSGGQLGTGLGRQPARAHSRVVIANRPNHFQNQGLLIRSAQLLASLLVVCLATDSEVLRKVLFGESMTLPQRVLKAGLKDGATPFF